MGGNTLIGKLAIIKSLKNEKIEASMYPGAPDRNYAVYLPRKLSPLLSVRT